MSRDYLLSSCYPLMIRSSCSPFGGGLGVSAPLYTGSWAIENGRTFVRCAHSMSLLLTIFLMTVCATLVKYVNPIAGARLVGR